MTSARKTLAASALLVALVGCGGKTDAVSPGAGQVARLEGACQVAGLSPPLRQTVLIIDQTEVKKVASAEQVRLENPELFQLILGLGDPHQSVESGAMAARERLTVYQARADGSAPRLIFSGCTPGFSAEERKKLASGTSGAAKMSDSFFGKGAVQAVAEQADTFRTALIGALNGIATDAQPAKPAAPMPDRSLTRSLQALSQLAAEENGIPRLFLFTDLTHFAPEGLESVQQARARGFEDADKARLPLGMVEVHVVGPKPARDSVSHDYARAFFLGSQGRLLSWGGATFNTLPPPPPRTDTFAGEINYAPYTFPMQVRLAADRNGELVNSWIVVKKERSVATPLTGSYTCDAEAVCKITTDQGGLAQAWSTSAGPNPVFSQDLPLAGLRQLSAEVKGEVMQGRVFDPMVGKVGSANALTFKLTRTPHGPGSAQGES